MLGSATSDLCLRVGCEAMACRFEVWLTTADRAALGVVREGLDEVRTLDGRFSLFRSESELATLNGAAPRGPVPVAEDLFGLLQLARRVAWLSAGAYDVTSGALSRCWGLLERNVCIPSAEALSRARCATGWDHVLLDERARTVAFDTEGLELNLGSLGKGYALDRLAARLARAGVRDFLAHAGGSTAVAQGSAADGAGWPVLVRSTTGARRTEYLFDEALSTSGSHEQTFEVDGQRFCHILDPRNGRPSARVGTVSAIARSGAMAEAISTALFLLDGAPARQLLASMGARRCA